MTIFNQLLVNTFVANLTNMTVWFALTYYVYLSTHSVFATSLISGFHLVFTALTGLWFGGLVDHHHKKTVMAWSSNVSLISYLAGLIAYLSAPADAYTHIYSPHLWVLILLLLAGVIVGNLRNIALPTLVTLLVNKDDRAKANGQVGMVSGIGFMITSVISGFLVAKTGMLGALVGSVVVTIIALIHLMQIKIVEKKIIHLNNDHKNIDFAGTLKVIRGIPGLLALILFATFNNFLGGVFMSLMDAYGLSLVSVETWGLMWGFLSIAFIFGGIIISKYGLGKNPVKSLLLANAIIWMMSAVFTSYPSIYLLLFGSFIYLMVVPFIEASEHTIFQNLVPQARQGRVFGFAQTVEQAASPITAFAIGPITEFLVIPFMTDGVGATVLGPYFGTGPARGIALVFTVAGLIGLTITVLATRSRPYRQLSAYYLKNSK
ncbi:MFS transporter [Candidatus Woesebacteria bacterium]|nr:MFS transporter [Candidatus Woesebacteria bacterium]